ncbi:Zinc finger protein RTS2 [Candida viswanathii]|uniref:Zinc finger protein RTS2 n=1 Tax=Candida viswanathii TaxID=5486 RepID=A0A367XRM4_9ASCO|nr:Zinc finger protein RTS2 [Candida viswanathii]
MAKAEQGTAKYQSKKLKASGLQKLKFYCQLCQKQCRDANGFKNHLASPSHRGRVSQIQDLGETSKLIANYSDQFVTDFLRLLKMNHGTKFINANKFYQEYIRDKDHVHMNSTRWRSLTSFVKYLGKNGKVKVKTNQEGESDDDEGDEEGFNLEIKFIDPHETLKTLQEKTGIEDEVDEEKLLLKQIKKGQKLEQETEQVTPVEQPSVSGPIKLSLKKKAPAKKKLHNAFDSEE